MPEKIPLEETLIYYVLKEELIGGEGVRYGVFYQEDGLVERLVGTQDHLLNLTSIIKGKNLKKIYNLSFSRPESFPELRIERYQPHSNIVNFYKYTELTKGEQAAFLREISEEE